MDSQMGWGEINFKLIFLLKKYQLNSSPSKPRAKDPPSCNVNKDTGAAETLGQYIQI